MLRRSIVSCAPSVHVPAGIEWKNGAMESATFAQRLIPQMRLHANMMTAKIESFGIKYFLLPTRKKIW